MIRQRHARVLLLAALCTLASAATAYAECAWVLWGRKAVIKDVSNPPAALRSLTITQHLNRRRFRSKRDCDVELANRQRQWTPH
jgi:hypothetical protein